MTLENDVSMVLKVHASIRNLRLALYMHEYIDCRVMMHLYSQSCFGSKGTYYIEFIFAFRPDQHIVNKSVREVPS